MVSTSTPSPNPSTPIIIHHLNDSRSQRIIFLLEELNLNYEVTKYARGADQRAPKELEKCHSLGKAPVLQDGRHLLAESGCIVEYLVDTYGHDTLKPARGTDEAILYSQWMHFAEGSLMPPLLISLVFGFVVKQVPILIRGLVKAISGGVHAKLIDPDLKHLTEYVERNLELHQFMAGSQFSAADVMMTFPLEALMKTHAAAFVGPHTKEWLKRMHARPAYVRALERGGEYKYVK
ncbi:hypothetical protein HKX48_003884 [Thoreauomyces humboldtii]|nr:hypothetical protein HKX48_003884 [Thoreauomyces humboldtii]